MNDRLLIDVYMTTYRRPDVFAASLRRLLEACAASPFDHRITVIADDIDEETLKTVAPHIGQINLLSSCQQLGMPFGYNLMLQHSDLVAGRTERACDYLCYFSDDCLIEFPGDFFDILVKTHREVLPAHQAGYVSGFYCPLHPGFETRRHRHYTVVLSDSVDGKNFMAPPATLRSVGTVTWRLADGQRRGNPGPGRRGSEVDIWQWRDSPTSLQRQGRVNLIVPGLCSHAATRPEQSTWNNVTTPEFIAERIRQGRYYRTRETEPRLTADQFYRGAGRR